MFRFFTQKQRLVQPNLASGEIMLLRYRKIFWGVLARKQWTKENFCPFFPTCQFNAMNSQPVCFNIKYRINKRSGQISQCPGYYIHTYIHMYMCVWFCVYCTILKLCYRGDFVVLKVGSSNRDCNVRTLCFITRSCHWACDEQFPLPKPSFSLPQRG